MLLSNNFSYTLCTYYTPNPNHNIKTIGCVGYAIISVTIILYNKTRPYSCIGLPYHRDFLITLLGSPDRVNACSDYHMVGPFTVAAIE